MRLSEELLDFEVAWDLAEATSERITRKEIRLLQRMHDLHSGEDSGLKNVWDEICVQVQGERSFLWDAYDEVMRRQLEALVDELSSLERQAIWLQTGEGESWIRRHEDEDEDCPAFVDDIVDYLAHSYLYSKAADWHNARIERFLERGY